MAVSVMSGLSTLKIDKHNNTENDELFFCMKCPLWSVYSTSNTNMEYNLCQHCMNHESSIIFNYEMLDMDLLHTSIIINMRKYFLAFQSVIFV